MPEPICPKLAVDVIVEIGRQIVLIERKHFPLGWALPGGFVDVGESVEAAALREMEEELSLKVRLTALLGVYSRPDRDPRGHTVSVVYIGESQGVPVARDDARNAALFDPAAPPSPLAFDHGEILADYRAFRTTGKLPSPKFPASRTAH